MTFSEYVPRWREKAWPWLKPRTRDGYARMLRLHLEPRFGGLALDAITRSDVAAALADLRTTLAPGTVRLALAVLSIVLEAAVNDGHILVSPTRGMVRAYRRWFVRDTRADLSLPAGVAPAVLLHAEQSHRDLYRVYATYSYTGMRRNEALGLQLADLSFKDQTIHVRRQWHGNGEVGTPKGGRARTIDMAPQLVPVLMAAAERSREIFAVLQLGKDHPRWLFPNPERGVPYSPRHVGEYLRKLGRDLGVGRVTPRMIRHTVASALREAGESLGYIQELLGHADERTTAHYAQHRKPPRRGSLRVLASM